MTSQGSPCPECPGSENRLASMKSTSKQDNLGSPSLWDGDGSPYDDLFHITLLVGFKHFISVYLEMIYSMNLCNQHFPKELQSFGCNEDKSMIMLFKMDEDVTKEHL